LASNRASLPIRPLPRQRFTWSGARILATQAVRSAAFAPFASNWAGSRAGGRRTNCRRTGIWSEGLIPDGYPRANLSKNWASGDPKPIRIRQQMAGHCLSVIYSWAHGESNIVDRLPICPHHLLTGCHLFTARAGVAQENPMSDRTTKRYRSRPPAKVKPSFSHHRRRPGRRVRPSRRDADRRRENRVSPRGTSAACTVDGRQLARPQRADRGARWAAGGS
jgi:hypothetical protein